MAYKIRYGVDRYKQDSLKQTVQIQILVSGGLLLLTGLAEFLDRGALLVEGILTAQPMNVTEWAVSAFADTLARGEGWYQGLAVWCRTIIDAGMG